MTDAHTHIAREGERAILAEPCVGEAMFYGYHPWYLENYDLASLRRRLEANPRAGVGEIGLDRLRSREIPPRMREAFEAQLALAAELRRPVVLHGAKCWGQVVAACRKYCNNSPDAPGTKHQAPGTIPAFLFHGFSRSGGLVPDIVKLNGFISVGPAILNDHALNYRELVKSLPLDRVLVESDATAESAVETPGAREVAAKLAELRGIPPGELESILDRNLAAFFGADLPS